jgi:hypothetical protein
MNEKFRGVPVEEDTKVLRRAVVTVGELEVLHEKWSWDGVRGDTFVFVSSEVADIGNEALEGMVRLSALVEPGSQVTIKRSDSGYTFVSFNFRA